MSDTLIKAQVLIKAVDIGSIQGVESFILMLPRDPIIWRREGDDWSIPVDIISRTTGK